ncbi:hypothetical protein TNCV_1876241 [Trichonephila clavipes]|nr:hypothetical protein TNCV_1876241 [Trichonephila clavipes]
MPIPLGYGGSKHIFGTENNLLKVCTSTGIRNYGQRSSGKPERGTAVNTLRSGIFLPYHIASRELIIFKQSDLQLKKWASHTLKGGNLTKPSALISVGRTMRNTSVILSVTTDWRVRNNSHLSTLSACRPVLRLNTSSPTISGNEWQMMTSSKISVHKTFCLASSTTRLPGGNFQNVKISMKPHLSDLPDAFWS